MTKRARCSWVVVHLLGAAVWLGVLLCLAATGDQPAVLVGVAAAGGVVCVGSGVVLGAGTPWGLRRYRWVTNKIRVAVVVWVLAGLSFTRVVPGVPARWVGVGLLVVALVLSVARPGGRYRVGRHHKH